MLSLLLWEHRCIAITEAHALMPTTQFLCRTGEDLLLLSVRMAVFPSNALMGLAVLTVVLTLAG